MKLSSLFGVDIYNVYMIYPLIGNKWKNGLNKFLKTRGKRGVSPLRYFLIPLIERQKSLIHQCF